MEGFGGGGAVEEAVEEELEGGVGLAAEGDLRAEEEDFALAYVGLRNGDGVVEVGLAPGPAAVEEVAFSEPGDGLEAVVAGVGSGAEGGRVVVEDVGRGGHAVGDGLRGVDLRTEERAGDVEALGWDGLLLAADDLGEGIVDGQVHGGVDAAGAADGEQGSSVFDEGLELRKGFFRGEVAEPGAELGRDGLGGGLDCSASSGIATGGSGGWACATFDGPGRKVGEDAVGKDEVVKGGVEVAGVDGLGIDDGVGEFELVKEPAQPAGGDDAAVLVGEADAGGMEEQGLAGGLSGDRIGVDAQGFGGCFEQVMRLGGVRNVEGSGGEGFASGYRRRLLEPEDGKLGFEQAIGEGVGVVVFVRDEVAGGFSNAADGAGRRCGQVGGDLFKRAGEAGVEAGEGDAHLIGEGPAGGVVGAGGRGAGVGKVVGVVLGLEHVEDLGAVALGTGDDERAGGVVFAVDVEGGRGTLDGDAGLHKGVDEFDGGGEVGLVGGKDVAAGVAMGGVVEDGGVEAGGGSAEIASAADDSGRGASGCGSGVAGDACAGRASSTGCGGGGGGG